MVRPVRVLQVPHGPLLTRQQVLDLQPRGGVAARLGAEARGDLEAAVGDRVVTGAQSGPVAEALLTPSLLEEGAGRECQWAGQAGENPAPTRGARKANGRTSSAVTMAMMDTPCSQTICQKSWHVLLRGPCVAM